MPMRSSGGGRAVAIVDEFPHTNVPGSGREKRWEDVHVLLDNGIDVLTTMNVQHLESLNDQIWQSTGVRVRETIPDWVLQQADEVVMVDLTPQRAAQPLEARRRVRAGEGAAGAGELLSRADACGASRAGHEADGVCGGKPPADGHARRHFESDGDRADSRCGAPAAPHRARSVERRADPARAARRRLSPSRLYCGVRHCPCRSARSRR